MTRLGLICVGSNSETKMNSSQKSLSDISSKLSSALNEIIASLGTANASLAAVADALGDSLGTMGRPLYVKTISASMATGFAVLQCDENTCNATRIRIRYTALSTPNAVLAVGYGMSAPNLFSAVCVLRSFDEFVDDVPPGNDINCILFDETIDGDYQEAVGGINDYVQVSYYA